MLGQAPLQRSALCKTHRVFGSSPGRRTPSLCWTAHVFLQFLFLTGVNEHVLRGACRYMQEPGLDWFIVFAVSPIHALAY